VDQAEGGQGQRDHTDENSGALLRLRRLPQHMDRKSHQDHRQHQGAVADGEPAQ
jgi:hypothetical protein